MADFVIKSGTLEIFRRPAWPDAPNPRGWLAVRPFVNEYGVGCLLLEGPGMRPYLHVSGPLTLLVEDDPTKARFIG